MSNGQWGIWEHSAWETGKVEVLTWEPLAGDQPCSGESRWRRQRSLRTSTHRGEKYIFLLNSFLIKGTY